MISILAQVRLWAAQTPTYPALESTQIQLSYAELQRRIDILSQLLRRARPRHIGILLGNSPDWVVIQLAAFAAGIPVTPIPTFFSPKQQRHALNQSGVTLLFCDQPDYAAELDPDFRPDPALHPLALSRDIAPVTLPEGTLLVTFTSGSTGTPKGVCLDGALLSRVCRALFQRVGHAGVERHACLLPLAVLLENLAGVFLPFYAGGCCLLASDQETGLQGSSGLDLPQFANFLHQHQPESLILTPELLKALLHLHRSGLNCDQFKLLAVGGARVPLQLLQQAQQLGLPVIEGYGLSECGSVVALNALDQPGAGCGQPLEHCQIEIASDGEILVRGPAMLGYVGEEPLPAYSLVHTGDLGYLDSHGNLHVQGRTKNLFINSFGRNFSPEWIEAEFSALPEIRQFCLFGDHQPFNTAVLLPMPGVSEHTLELAINRLNTSLPDYARVSRWIIAEQPFSASNEQLTANGRIRRQAIADQYRWALDSIYPTTQEQPHAVL